MPTPFDPIIDGIIAKRYHNHRLAEHSDILTAQILKDLNALCDAYATDRRLGIFREWTNVIGPDGRNTDLLVASTTPDGKPDLGNVRIVIEHKSVVTAHRNRNARCQDIEREMRACHALNPRTIVIATLIIGTQAQVLNIPDCVKKDHRYTPSQFETDILPRLSSGDMSLWQEFNRCISLNKASEPLKTLKYFQRLPVRETADTHTVGLDYLLFIPMAIDNVNPPRLATLAGVDACKSYGDMINRICQLYQMRWQGR